MSDTIYVDDRCPFCKSSRIQFVPDDPDYGEFYLCLYCLARTTRMNRVWMTLDEQKDAGISVHDMNGKMEYFVE